MSSNYFENYSENNLHLTNHERMNRWCTDLPHLIIFSIFFELWIGIAFHAYSAGAPPKYPFSHFQTENGMTDHPFAVDISFQSFIQCSTLSASFIWLAVSFLGLYFIPVRFYTKKIIYSTLYLMGATLIVFLFFVIYCFRYYAIPICTIIITVYGLTIYIVKQVGMKTLCSIVLEACKAMIDLPSTFIITMVQINLMVLVTLFTISVISNLMAIPNKLEFSITMNSAGSDFTQVIRGGPPSYAIVFTIIFLSCSLWMITLIYNFGRVALYGTFATWHRTVDKNSIPRIISIRNMFISFRYHFGNVTFGSTIFAVIQILRVTLNYRTELFGKFKNRPITIFCFLTLLANGTTNALIACASHGTSFYRSTKDSFKLIMQNSLTFAATRIVTEWMIAFGVAFIPGLTLLIASLYFVQNSIYYLPMVPILSIIIIELVSLWITLVFLVTLRAAIATRLFCYLEDSSSNTLIADKDLLDRNIGDEIVAA